MTKNNISGGLCSGCGGCTQICPAGCIQIKKDAQGFYRATVEEDRCLNCGLCVKKCSMNRQQPQGQPLKSFAVYHKEEQIRRKSSSGGVFTALARQVLEAGGAVVGAAFDEEMHLRHTVAENEEQLQALRGSKYLQSNVTGVFPRVRGLLEEGRQVLFVGTPCQVAGLYTALGKRYENLLTCDLVCHGAPSAGLFEGYLAFLEKKYKGKVIGYDFRSKDRANDRMSYTVKLTVQTAGGVKQHFLSGDEEPYTMRFISGALQAESCYRCPYTSHSRVGDLTLADYWGYEQAHPELAQVIGVSLVLVNTAAGETLLAQAGALEKLPTTPERYLKRNNHLSAPAKAHPQRSRIYGGFADMGFSKRFYQKYFLPDGYSLYILKRRLRGIRGR